MKVTINPELLPHERFSYGIDSQVVDGKLGDRYGSLMGTGACRVTDSTCQKATCLSGMRSPAVSLFGLGKTPPTTEFQAYLKHLHFISPSPSLPTVPFYFFALHSPSSVISYLPPSFVNSHRLFHRQSLPDSQQTDSVFSLSYPIFFPVASNRLLTPAFPFRSLDPASRLPTSCS